MLFLLVTVLVAGALSAPAPQLSHISPQGSGVTRLVPLFIQDLDASPNTLIPVVVPAPAQQTNEETSPVSQVAADLSDVANVVQAEENVEEAIREEISEAAAVGDAIDVAVEEVQSSGAPETVVQAELAQAGEAKAAVEETVTKDLQLVAEAEEAALGKIAEDVIDIAAAADAESSINGEVDLSDGGRHTPLPDALSTVMAMVIEAGVEEQSVPVQEAQDGGIVGEQATETAILEPELVDSTVASETEAAEPEVVQEVVLVDTAENSAIQTEAAGEVVAVEEEPSQVQGDVTIQASANGNFENDGSTGTQVIEVAEESPVEEEPSITPEEELQISTVDDTIAEAEAVVAQAEEVLSGVVDVTLNKKASESAQNEASSKSRGKSLSSAAEATTADSGSGPVADEVVTLDAATRSAIQAALTGQAPDTAAIVIFPQATAETQTDADLLIEEGSTSQTDIPLLTEAGTPELETASETFATIPVEATTDSVIVNDEALETLVVSEVEIIPESSASQTAEVVSSPVAVETSQLISKQRPTPAIGNLLVNPATKSAFFSTSSFGSPISAANIILGQPVRVPGRLGFSGAITPQLQGSSNLQARNLVDPQFRQFIFDNDSPDVVAAKVNFFRVRAATLGAPIAISVAPTPASSSAVAPEAAPSVAVAIESEPSAAPEAAAETESSPAQEVASSSTTDGATVQEDASSTTDGATAQEVASSTTVEVVESEPSEAAQVSTQ